MFWEKFVFYYVWSWYLNCLTVELFNCWIVILFSLPSFPIPFFFFLLFVHLHLHIYVQTFLRSYAHTSRRTHQDFLEFFANRVIRLFELSSPNRKLPFNCSLILFTVDWLISLFVNFLISLKRILSALCWFFLSVPRYTLIIPVSRKKSIKE